MTGLRARWIVSAAFVIAILTVAPVAPPARAISNGTVDPVHTFAGALIFPNVFGFGFYTGHTDYVVCSGSLVAPRVFLVAAHCFDVTEAGGLTTKDLAVSFATNIFEDQKSWLSVESYARHPDYKVREGSPHNDVGVVILTKPVKGIAPATMAPVGFLDAYGSLEDATFTIIGYGLNDTFVFTGNRHMGISGFTELGEDFVKISGAPSTFCPGDSGGPTLLPANGIEYQVSLHASRVGHTLKPPCEGPAFEQRIDTPGVQAFIEAAIAANP